MDQSCHDVERMGSEKMAREEKLERKGGKEDQGCVGTTA